MLNTKDMSVGSGKTKPVISAGNHIVRINSVSFDQTPYDAEAYNILLNVETQPVADKSPDSADHVHASGYWKTVKGVSELVVKVNIDKGYHINANPASDPQLIATQLLLTKQLVMNVNYPPSQTFKAPFAPSGIAVYQGQITLTVPLPHPQEQELPVVSLRVQACNDKVCLAPAIITVPSSLSEN